MSQNKYEIDISYWCIKTQEFVDYTITCTDNGLVVAAPYGHKQYIGTNFDDIIKGYQFKNIGYRWSKVTPFIKKGYSNSDAIRLAVGLKKESECQIMLKLK